MAEELSMFTTSGARFIEITPQGGLGNQLFQLATGLAQARRLKTSLGILPLKNAAGNTPREMQLQDFQSIPGVYLATRRRSRRKFVEGSPFFDPRIEKIEPGTNLIGYFQSPKYFQRVEPEFLAVLRGSNQFQQGASLAGSREFIAIHFRRGDYLREPFKSFHGLLGTNYFLEGMRLIRTIAGELPAIVFSDSNSDAKLLSEQIENCVVWGENALSPLETVGVMAQAKALLLSNSSFSWWAGYLAADANVIIAPRPWMRGVPGIERDLLPDDWLQLGANGQGI